MSATPPKTTKKDEEQTQHTYNIGDIALGKLRGYPPWPGQVMDPEKTSVAVQRERPRSKIPFYCVRFFPAGDYSWLVAKDLSPLSKEHMDEFINRDDKKRNAKLLDAYKTARDPDEWIAGQDAAAARAQLEEANAEVDQLDDEDGGKKGGKKRRRDDAGKGRKRKAKTDDDDDDDDEPKKKKRIAPKRKGADADDKKKKGRKDAKEDEEDTSMASDPEAVKIKEWRHKLQRAFLRDGHPIEETSLPEYDETFKIIENYEGLTLEYLSYSKIGKVMKKISQLSPEAIPGGDQYNFRQRSTDLIAKWHNILNQNQNQSLNLNLKKDEGMGIEVQAATTNGAEEAPPINGANTSVMEGDLTMMTDAA